MQRLLIIIASTRPGRLGLPIAEWFVGRARSHGCFEVEVADLVELGLPLLNEPEHPRLRRYAHAHTHAWSRIVDAADGFVIVTGEYNHGYPGSLKNAIDYLYWEWQFKPLGFVSYSGVSAGTRAAQQLKQVAASLKMMPLFEAVHIPFVTRFIDENGALRADDIMEQAADAMLDELLRVAGGMRCLRPSGPI